MKSVYLAIYECLKKKQPVILATVTKSMGSTPRKAGAKMAIFEDGSIIGSIGGGAIEAAVTKTAGQLWDQPGALLKEYKLDSRKAAALGMICGGEQQILLSFVEPDPKHLEVFEALAGLGSSNQPRYLFTKLEGDSPRFGTARLGLICAQGQKAGFEPGPEFEAVIQKDPPDRGPLFLNNFHGYNYIVEKLSSQAQLFIFGAGHVARPTVAMAAMLGFEITVLDDRPEFANKDNFPQAHYVTVLNNFTEAFSGLPLSDNAFLVIITRGHSHDQMLLEKALESPSAYIGMIGSKNKVKTCFESLKQKGWSKTDLDRVYAPIGIDIGSETPEEIAVSIVAQLIQVRSQCKK
ncbi:MAG: XdhC family protein [Desulfobacteraceae bacterium]|nr:XdhC family protein [Desulfobacteraceae bacterium]